MINIFKNIYYEKKFLSLKLLKRSRRRNAIFINFKDIEFFCIIFFLYFKNYGGALCTRKKYIRKKNFFKIFAPLCISTYKFIYSIQFILFTLALFLLLPPILSITRKYIYTHSRRKKWRRIIIIIRWKCFFVQQLYWIIKHKDDETWYNLKK